jgi:hypothetical protein
MPPPLDGVLDEALERFEQCGPEFGRGLANHGPMATEAMIQLGHIDDVPAWVDEYCSHLDVRPDGIEPITDETWPDAIGDIRRITDWTIFFRHQLDDAPVDDVLARWIPRLLPGVMAAATHGVIRTAHALRSLSQHDTPPRRNELAAGLAYWAARYQTLPGKVSLAGRLPVGDALADLPSPPPEAKKHFLISHAVEALNDEPAFALAADNVARPPSVETALSELTAAMAALFLADPGHATIAYLHGVTAPAAVRLLLPHLPTDLHLPAFAGAWHASAALAAAFGWAPAPAITAEPLSWAELAGRAVATGDEHAIKLTEACRRENEIAPSPFYAAAALAASDRLGGQP